MPGRSMSEARRLRMRAVQRLLSTRYPQLFPSWGTLAPQVPFAIGLFEVIAAQVAGDVDAPALRDAFSSWCHSPRYLRALACPGAIRHDVTGPTGDTVSSDAAAAAAAQLIEYNLRQAAKAAAARHDRKVHTGLKVRASGVCSNVEE